MGFHKGAYATIWEIESKGKFAKVQLSTSRKNKETNEYETDFSGYVSFVGEAYRNLEGVNPKDRICIGNCDVTTTYNKDKKTSYVNYTIFSFEKNNKDNNADSVHTSAKTEVKNSKQVAVLDDQDDDDSLPF